MPFSIFSRILITERLGKKARVEASGFAPPVVGERYLDKSQSNLVVTNTKGKFISTRTRSDGLVRFAFCHCPLENEADLMVLAYQDLLLISKEKGWPNRALTIEDAVKKLQSSNLEPRSLLISPDLVPEISAGKYTLENAREVMAQVGVMAHVEGVQVLLAELPKRSAIVWAAPALAGYYTRSEGYLGVLLLNVAQTLILVG